MDEENKEINLLDYALNGVVFLAAFLYYLFANIHTYKVVQFFCFCIILIIPELILPMIAYRKDAVQNSKTVRAVIFCRVGLFLLLIFLLYRIILSKNYELQITYWLFFLSLAILTIGTEIEKIRTARKKRKAGEVKKRPEYNILNICLLMYGIIIPAFTFAIHGLSPKTELTFHFTELPKSFYISQLSSGISESISHSVDISSTEDVQIIMNELNSVNAESLDFPAVLNFEKMAEDNQPKYIMVFDHYELLKKGKPVKKNNFAYILITSNKMAVIINADREVNLFLKDFHEMYPIKFSEETMDMIFRYINSTGE